MDKFLSWLFNIGNPRKYYYNDCDCGQQKTCPIKRYTTSKGGLGIESGLGKCGKVKHRIEQMAKMDITNDEQE